MCTVLILYHKPIPMPNILMVINVCDCFMLIKIKGIYSALKFPDLQYAIT